ncbi:hypothetical protein [Erythrobacter colymbi]|uniref:hypothetical protein n=1 Tax=Erythrobacter colymbi TaxID=1161202 RepID=UPI00117F35A6|nr:hypothetical protein [Erythrobacter colymbi]
MMFGTSGFSEARGQDRQGAAPHPAMAAFLNELDAGALDAAASRISRIGDFGDEDVFAIRPSRGELVALLRSCRQISGMYGVSSSIYSQLQQTEWSCPGDQIYTVNFWPEDALSSSSRVPRPYLMVAAIETPESRSRREEKRKVQRTPDGAMPPPPIRLVRSEQEQKSVIERQELERLAAYGRRDAVGEAVVKGKLEAIADFVTDETQVRYGTRDPYFDVRLEDLRGKGMAALIAVISRASSDVGSPVAFACRLGDGQWPPQVCQWELSDPNNGLRADMNFSGPGGTINSIRLYRETPTEADAFRQRAIRAGVING